MAEIVERLKREYREALVAEFNDPWAQDVFLELAAATLAGRNMTRKPG